MSQTWILLVEDDPDHEALALRALRKTNIDVEVEVARSGVEALDCLFRAPQHGREPVPRVVLLDLKLPQMSGFDVLHHLRSEERTRLVPVVVMTSSDDESDIVNSYSLGANSFMQKPVNYDAFVETIREVGRHWLSKNRT
jgi:two-component system, response regulator